MHGPIFKEEYSRTNPVARHLVGEENPNPSLFGRKKGDCAPIKGP